MTRSQGLLEGLGTFERSHDIEAPGFVDRRVAREPFVDGFREPSFIAANYVEQEGGAKWDGLRFLLLPKPASEHDEQFEVILGEPARERDQSPEGAFPTRSGVRADALEDVAGFR